MVVAVAELDLELDPPEERARRVEDDAVRARLRLGEIAHAAVVVGDALARNRPVRAQQLDGDPGRGSAAFGVEDVVRAGALVRASEEEIAREQRKEAARLWA